ncbi:MAG TPA: helix-turn-helix domain-containing protein, partial [Candidatus Gracilibacteria bacterium]|nr:helix-turn-helix domain-containing protein [Candidatus Gracilibacteria bacterium]
MNLEDTLQLLRTLKEVGLSANEANVYLTLLTLGPNPVSTVAKKANLNRSSCYTILDRLMQ